MTVNHWIAWLAQSVSALARRSEGQWFEICIGFIFLSSHLIDVFIRLFFIKEIVLYVLLNSFLFSPTRGQILIFTSNSLTLKWPIKVFLLLLHVGVQPWNPPSKETSFPPEAIIPKKINKNVEPFQNGGQITYFHSVASFLFWPKLKKKKKKKTLSQRNFSMKFGSK